MKLFFIFLEICFAEPKKSFIFVTDKEINVLPQKLNIMLKKGDKVKIVGIVKTYHEFGLVDGMLNIGCVAIVEYINLDGSVELLSGLKEEKKLGFTYSYHPEDLKKID